MASQNSTSSIAFKANTDINAAFYKTLMMPLHKDPQDDILVNMYPTMFSDHLYFNGETISHVKDGKTIMSWAAVSGKEGKRSKEFQHIEGEGPLPEGLWRLRQNNLQSIDDISIGQRFIGIFGQGKWPGLERSWGNQRIWIDP